MAIWGLDVQEVQALASKLEKESNDIQSIMQQLTSKLESTTWKGPDADRFRNEWNTEHKASLKKVIQALHQAGQTARHNANAQESTSQA